jgi:hypothetical protein
VTISPYLAIATPPVAVIPVLIGPLQVLIAILPGLLAAVFMAIVGMLRPQALLQFARLLWRLKYHVLAAALCVVGIRSAAMRLRPQTSRAAAVAGVETSGEWTTFRGGVRRTGAMAGTQEPSKGQVNWTARPNERFYASPAVVDKRVYVATAADISPVTSAASTRIPAPSCGRRARRSPRAPASTGPRSPRRSSRAVGWSAARACMKPNAAG